MNDVIKSWGMKKKVICVMVEGGWKMCAFRSMIPRMAYAALNVASFIDKKRGDSTTEFFSFTKRVCNID